MAIRTMYHDMTTYEIHSSNPGVSVSEAKSTNVNGYIKGEVKNESEEEISGKYLCFLLCNADNDIIEKQYIEIGNISPKQTKTFELNFKRDGITRAYIIVTDKQV